MLAKLLQPPQAQALPGAAAAPPPTTTAPESVAAVAHVPPAAPVPEWSEAEAARCEMAGSGQSCMYHLSIVAAFSLFSPTIRSPTDMLLLLLPLLLLLLLLPLPLLRWVCCGCTCRHACLTVCCVQAL